MGIDLPEPLRWLFKLTGSEWPDADEDKIAAFGEHVNNLSTKIDSVNSNMVETVRLANVSNAGPAMTQYTDNLRDVVNNGMPGMSVGARAMAIEIHDAALQAEYSKGTAVINMAIMAPMIAEAIANAPETFGATMAIAEAGVAAIRTTVPKLLTQMVEKVVTNTAMMEAGDLAVQGYQVLVKRDRSGFDGNLSLNTIEMGAIGGAVDGALTGALMKGAPKFFKSAEAGVTDASKLVWAPPKWANMATQVANNTVTSLIMDGINGQPIDGLSLLQGAALGAAMGGLHRAPGVKVKPFDDFHMNEDFLNGDSWVRLNSAYTEDKTGTNDFSFNIRRQPGSTDGTKTVWYGDPDVTHPEGTPPLNERLGPVIDKALENHPEGAPKPRFTVLEDVPPTQLDGIRTLAADKGVDIVVPHGAVETGPYGSIRVPGTDGGSGFRMVHPDGSVDHLGSVYDPRQTVSEPIVGGEPPEVRLALGSGGEKFVSKEVAGEGDCTVASLADSALSQGVAKQSIHAEGLNLNDPGDMREFRNRIADQVTGNSTDTRPGSGVLLGELSADGARTVLDRLGPPKASSSSHLDALDLATPAPRPVADPIRELNNRLEQDPATVLSALENHYSADGDKGMAQLTAYAKAKVEAGGDVPQHRDLLDYAIRERTLAETPLGGEMLQAVAHTLGLDVVVVSGDKPAFHLNGDSAKRVYVHRVTTEDGRNHYRALRPETKPLSKLSRRTPHPLPGDRPKPARRTSPDDASKPSKPSTSSDTAPKQPARRVPVSSRGGHSALSRKPTGSVGNALHRLAGGAHDQTGTDTGVAAHRPPRPTTPHEPHQDVSTLMQRAGHAHNAPPRPADGFESTAGPDVMGVRAVPDKPAFLAAHHLDNLPPENSAKFFDGIDLARPDGPPHDLGDLFTGAGTAHTPPRIPKLLHSIWLGGPLHADKGDRANFMKTMGANADKTGFTSVLWTDVPRNEIDQLRALDPDAPRTERQEHVQQMLDWAGDHNVKLANLDEVFAGGDKAELHTEIATERARTTGSGYAGASDLLRLDILHRFGGVYTDGDNKATDKLAELVDTVEGDQAHGQFGISSLNGSINNSAFIAPPGNRIVHDYRASLKERYTAPLREVMAEKHARGKADLFEAFKPLQDHVRFSSRDVRSEVITRTGPTAWSFDKLARGAGAPDGGAQAPRHWFTTITKEHLETGSESSWLSDATKPPAGTEAEHAEPDTAAEHVPTYLDPAKTVQAAVTVLHREVVNREGVLHLPSVMDIVDKAAPEHREQVWHAVLHTMHETWPNHEYPKPDIVVSGRFQTPSKRGDSIGRNQSIPRPIKDYLHDSGLFPNATTHTEVGHDFSLLPEDRQLRQTLTRAELRNIEPEQARDISRVHKLLFGDTFMSDADQVRDAAKVLDLLHATSPGDTRTDPMWVPKALRDLVEFRIGDEGNYDPAHLTTLIGDHTAVTRRGDLTPGAYRRHAEYAKAIPKGEDPEKFAGSMSPRPPSRKLLRLSAAQHAARWDRAVDVMALKKELGEVSPEQERGLWKLVGLYRKTPGNAVSDRPLTLQDMAEFRNQLAGRHPELGTVTDPKAWTQNMADRAYALSPETGKVTIDELVRHVHEQPDEPHQPSATDDPHYGTPYPEPPATLKWFHEDAVETTREFDELGPLVSHLPPAHFRDLIGHAGAAAEHPERRDILRQLHINIAHLQPDDVRTSIQGSRFHRRLSDELRKYGADPEIDKRDLPAFQHPDEAARFRAEYVEARPDGSGIWIRDPQSQHDMQTHATSRTMLPDPDHFSVVLHGSPQQVHVGKATLSARDMANLLQHTPEWAANPRPIRLIACNTGEHDEGFAQQLADLLGVEVKAPNTVVWGVFNGKPYASTLVRRPDGTYKPVKEADGAYRVFSPHSVQADGGVSRTPIRLDTEYDYLGRKPALTVLSRALAGSFGDTLAGADPVTQKIVNDWRHLISQTGGDSEKAFEVSESARTALDKVLTPDTVQWMFQHAPAGSEVNQALHVLSGSRSRSQHGGYDAQPPGMTPSAYVYDPVTANARGAGLSVDAVTAHNLSAIHRSLFPDTAPSDVPSIRQAHNVMMLARTEQGSSTVRPSHVQDLVRHRFGPDATITPDRIRKLSDEYTALKTLGPIDEHAWRTHLEYAKARDTQTGEVPRAFTSDRLPTEHEARTWTDVLTVADDMGFHPADPVDPAAHTQLSALWKTVETHREVLPAHAAALERPIRYADLENLGRQLGLQRGSDESQLAFVQRLSTNVGSFRAAHPNQRLSASAMARHLETRDAATTPTTPRPARTAPLRPRTEITDDQAKTLSDSLGGFVPPEGLKKLAAVNLTKFPAFTDPRREPQVSDFTDLVHQLLGPGHDVEAGVRTLAAAANRARKGGSLSALDGALSHDDGGFVRAPWSRVRYEAYVPWSDRHAIERDAALLYYHAFGEHAPANPDVGTVRNMRRAMQVAKLAHSSYDRRGQGDPETFYRQLGNRLRPHADESGTDADSFKRLLSAAGSGDGRYQNPDFLAGPMRRRLHGADTPRPALGHDLPPEHIAASRAHAKKLPGLFTPTNFGGHEQIETRLRALIPGRGPLHFEVGLPTELREGFGAMADGGLTLRVTRDGHAYAVRLKALLTSDPERVEESAATAKNESRMFRTGDDGGASHGTSRTLTVDGGIKTGFGPLSVGANTGTSRIRSRELTSSEAFGGDIYLDPSDGTARHTVQTQVHIEVTDPASGHWLQDVPPADSPAHTVELRIQDHLTSTEGVDTTPHAITRPLDDPSIDHLLSERTGYGDQLKHGFLSGLHTRGLTLDEKTRADVDTYFAELSSPHNVASLHSTDPLRRAGLTTSITAKDSTGKTVPITLGAHAEAKTLTQVSASRAGLKMDTVARHTVKQGVSTGRGGGLPSSLTGGVKSHDGSASASLGVTGNSTRTETASLESAYTVTRTVRAEDTNASYQMESKLDLHIAVGDQTEHFTVPDATAWIRLRPADHARLISADGTPERKGATEDTASLDPHLMTSEGLPLGQVKRISNLDGLYQDLTTKLADHLPEEATGDLAKLFEEDPTGSFLHGTGDKHENWRRIVTAVSGPGLVQRADALAGEGVTVKLRIDGKDVPLRLSLGSLKPEDATSLGTDDKLMPISVHQASQTSRIRSSKQQDLALNTSLGVGKSNGLFNATITGRQTKASRSTVSGGVRQYTRSLSGSTLFDVGGRLSWKLEHAEKPIEGAVDGGVHLWVSSDLVKTAHGLGKPLPLRPLEAHQHSPLATTPIHMAVNGGGMDTLRTEIAKKNPDLASEFGSGRFAAELPLLSGGGVRVAPGVHWDVTPTGRPQVLKTLSVYVESHGEAGTAVDHDVEVRQGKGGSGFGGGAGDDLTGGVTVSHSRDTAQGSNTGRGENTSRLMTAKTVQMALVRTQVRHRVTGVGDSPIETVGETLVMVPLSELHNRQEHFDFPADTAEKVFENFKAPGEGDPSPALKSGMLFGPVGAHPDGGLGLEATAKADAAFGDSDLNEQVRDLLQTPTLASQIRKLSDGGLTHPIVTASGGRYELRIQARTVGRPVLHDTNSSGGAKMYNADVATSSERSGGSKTTSGAATFGVDTPHLTVSATHTRSGGSADVETRARRDIESGGLRFSGESVDEYRQDVEYTYTITRISHPMWNLHFGDRPPEALQKTVDGSYVSELRVFEPRTHALDTTTEPRTEPPTEPPAKPALSPRAVALDWHGQDKLGALFREAGGTEQRHSPQDTAVLSKGSFGASLHDVLKPGGAEFRGVDLGGRTLLMKRGVLVEGTLKAPKSVAFLKAGAERESFSHRDVGTTVEHSDSTKQESKGQLAASGVTPHGVTVGGRAGLGRATEVREKTSQTRTTEARPRWDREPGGLYAVHVPVELRLDFGRGGAPRSTTVDVLVHVDAAGAEALGVPAAKLRELRGEPEPVVAPVVPPHEPVVEPHEPVVAPHEPVVTAPHESPPMPAPPIAEDEHREPEPQPQPHDDEPALDAIPLDNATRDELSRFTPDELTRLETLARDTSAEDFRRLIMRVSLSPGSVPEAALLERVPGLTSRDHVLHAVQEVRGPEPVPFAAPTHASVAPLLAPFIQPGDDAVTVHTVPAGTTVYRLVDIRTAVAHLNGHIQPLNKLGWIHLGRGLYTASNREGANLYNDDRFDRVMLRLTTRRDMVGMNIREAGTNAAEIGYHLGEQHEDGTVDLTDAGRQLLDHADFVAVHTGEEGPHEIKFHDGALEHFDVHPDDGAVTGYGDGVLAVYGDWAQRSEHLPLGTDYTLSTIGRLATGADLPWHQVTAEHVRQLADAVGLPHDRIGELPDLIAIHMPETAEELREALVDEEPQPFAVIKQHQEDITAVGDALTNMDKPKYAAFRSHAGYQDVVDKAEAVGKQTDDRGHLAAVNDLHAAVTRFTDSLPPEQRQKFEHTDLANATGQAFARVSIVELRLRRDAGAFQVHIGHDFADTKTRTAWVEQFQKNFTEGTDEVLWIRNANHPADAHLKSAIDAMKAGPDRRYFTVALHGSPGSVHVGNGHLSVKEMAALVRANDSWAKDKRPIRLFSCYTGMDDHGYAHELAKELGVDVIAPNDKAWADRKGNTYVSENLYKYDDTGVPRPTPKRKSPETGAWRRFSPDGDVKLELAPGTKLERTAALTLLTRTLPRTEAEIGAWPDAAHAPLRTLAGVLRTSNTLFERHLIDSHMNTMRDKLSDLLNDETVKTLADNVPAHRDDLREALHQLSPDTHDPSADDPNLHDPSAPQEPHGDPVPHDPVAFSPDSPTPAEQALTTITTRLQNNEKVWVSDTRSGSLLTRPLTLVNGEPHLGSVRLGPDHMDRLAVAPGFDDRLSHSVPGAVPQPEVKPNGNQRMLFHNTSLMLGHFTGDIVRTSAGPRFGNQHLTIDKAMPALFAKLATQDPAEVQTFLSFIHHERTLAADTMLAHGFVAPANIHFRPAPARQRAIALPAWLGSQTRQDHMPPDPDPTNVTTDVTYARFRGFVETRLRDLGFPDEDRTELMGSLDWTASRFHPTPDTMTAADRTTLFAGLYLNAGERLDFSKKAVVLQRLSGHDVPLPLTLIVRDTSKLTTAMRTSLQQLRATLPVDSAARAAIQALLDHPGKELRPASPPLNAAISVIMEHYWPTILAWMPPPE
ncbi:hypothetical protein Caci_8487 [Catenulispora acidiphila DSM 44928]|uniref:Outer membrane channel protein CpnT-like N-terminal domain-containing protein n=1 Tax=Catenulispora acidiphila (strain DSM 44928 / JCM 14897 / NBRC 102108 / NRRL B-24433 / ID139908) TaxID=479433 RepID=C7PYI8_CATAD|nr:hypothetical protein [Catenulispora acidiphila]ACU77310.1 hypothetical protein Caci_8487 [Catenulispora acidiphila DSM 44928]